MRTKLLTLALFGFLLQIPLFAQDRTTVNATSDEISDNLDLRAVASIFGDSKDLQDFEQRLNDPRNKISNLDLNFDRQVDYLRVIEAVEKNTHLIILQAVLEKDVFQDVATIEVERDRNNQVQIQVVGDVFMYGPNYIYEPVYVTRPIIYSMFWVNNYNPYYSPYYYNYYPSYYYAWTPYPIYRYRRNIHIHINHHNDYHYCDNRRSTRAVAMYETRRTNDYERRNPNQSFSTRNTATNRYDLDQATANGRRTENAGTRNYNSANTSSNTRNSEVDGNVRGNNPVRNSNETVRTTTPSNSGRTTINRGGGNGTTTQQQPTRIVDQSSTSTRNTPQVNSNTSRNFTQQQPIRTVERSSNATRNTPQVNNATRATNTRSGGNSTGSRTYSRS